MPQGAFRRPPQFAFTFHALYREVIQINENKTFYSRSQVTERQPDMHNSQWLQSCCIVYGCNQLTVLKLSI